MEMCAYLDIPEPLCLGSQFKVTAPLQSIVAEETQIYSTIMRIDMIVLVSAL